MCLLVRWDLQFGRWSSGSVSYASFALGMNFRVTGWFCRVRGERPLLGESGHNPNVLVRNRSNDRFHLEEDLFTLLLRLHGSEPIAGLYPQTRQFVNVHGYISMKMGAANLHLGDNALLGIERKKPAVKRKWPASAFKFS